MGSSEFLKAAKSIRKNFDKAKENKAELTQGFFKPEQGKYPVAVTGAEIGKSKNGRWQVKWTFMFLSGDYKGKEVRSFDGLDSDQNWAYFFQHLDTLGIDTEDLEIEDVEKVLEKISKKKPKLRIQVKENGEYTNIYFLDQLTDEEAEELAEAEGDEDEDDDKEDDKEEKEKEEEDEEDDDDDEDEDEEDEDEEEEKKEDKKKKSKVKEEEPDDEDEDEDEEDEDEDEDDEEEEDELEIEKGMKIKCLDKKGKELGIGKIKAIDEKKGEVIVKINGKKEVFPFDRLRPAK